MNQVIEEIFKEKLTYTIDGKEIAASSHISKEQGELLFELIKINRLSKTLEIGCAQGVSSIYICSALAERNEAKGSHEIIDPFQMSDWMGAGINALQRSGLNNYKLIQEPSEIYLPKLIEHGSNSYDLIFVDGFHTFDHALIDCFYSTKLLKVGGFLVLDDTDMPPIHKLACYLKKYPCYKMCGILTLYPKGLLGYITKIFGFMPLSANTRHMLPRVARAINRRPRTIVFKKISDDHRKWNWYSAF